MYLVFDIGGTYIKYATMSESGDILDKGKVKTPYAKDGGLPRLIATLGEIYDQYKGNETIEGIALSVPGQIDVENGIVYGGGSLKYTHEAHLGELLSERCDGVGVALENDGKCAALAEVWLGNAKDAKDACVIVLGTGLAGAVIVDRHVLHGNRLMAGEISFAFGDMTRDQLKDLKPLEEIDVLEEGYRDMPFLWSTTCSTKALTVKVALAKGMDIAEVTGEQVFELVEQGDPEVTEIVEDWYFALAKCCCNLYMIIDPDIILIGGGISAQPRVIAGIKKYVEQLSKVCNVYRGIKLGLCKFQNDSNLYGALYSFMQNSDIRK